jgi:predicted nucleotidyltransferase
VDVAVYVDDSVKNYTEYELSLAVELERETGVDIDVRVLNDAPPAFRHRAVKGELLIDHDPERRFRFIEETVWEYLDYEPLERRMRKELLAG